MPFSWFKVIIFNHLSDTNWECLSSHRPLFHRAGTSSKPEPVPDWAPVLTVGLEPVGSLQNWSQAQDSCPVVAEPYLKEWQHYCREQRPLLFLHTHTSPVGSHACQGNAQTLADDYGCLDVYSHRGWIPDCASQRRGGITMFFFSEHRDLQYEQNLFRPTLANNT